MTSARSNARLTSRIASLRTFRKSAGAVDRAGQPDHDARIAERFDGRDGRRVVEHTVHPRQCLRAESLHCREVLFGSDADVEVEPPARVPRVVDDHTLVDHRVRDANVIPVDGHQHRGARGEAEDAALTALDEDEVILAEGLAQAEQQTGDVVLDGVAQREAEREPEDAGRAQHGSHQRGRVEEIERDDDADDQQRRAHHVLQQFGEEAIVRDAQKRGVPTADDPAEQPERRHDQRCDAEQWQERQQVPAAFGEPIEHARAVGRKHVLGRAAPRPANSRHISCRGVADEWDPSGTQSPCRSTLFALPPAARSSRRFRRSQLTRRSCSSISSATRQPSRSSGRPRAAERCPPTTATT